VSGQIADAQIGLRFDDDTGRLTVDQKLSQQSARDSYRVSCIK
jgi:hypothetical protein